MAQTQMWWYMYKVDGSQYPSSLVFQAPDPGGVWIESPPEVEAFMGSEGPHGGVNDHRAGRIRGPFDTQVEAERDLRRDEWYTHWQRRDQSNLIAKAPAMYDALEELVGEFDARNAELQQEPGNGGYEDTGGIELARILLAQINNEEENDNG